MLLLDQGNRIYKTIKLRRPKNGHEPTKKGFKNLIYVYPKSTQ